MSSGTKTIAQHKRTSAWRPRHKINGTFKKSKRGKYNASGRRIDGLWFASKAEGDRYEQLMELQKQGKIEGLTCQNSHPFHYKGHLICTYRDDFSYTTTPDEGPRVWVVEDVKGMITPVYKIKAKLYEAHYGEKLWAIPAKQVKTSRYCTAVDILGAR